MDQVIDPFGRVSLFSDHLTHSSSQEVVEHLSKLKGVNAIVGDDDPEILIALENQKFTVLILSYDGKTGNARCALFGDVPCHFQCDAEGYTHINTKLLLKNHSTLQVNHVYTLTRLSEVVQAEEQADIFLQLVA